MLEKHFFSGIYAEPMVIWPKAYYTDDAEIISNAMNIVRREIRRQDCPQGFQLFNCLSGGFRSGFTSLLLNKIRDNFLGPRWRNRGLKNECFLNCFLPLWPFFSMLWCKVFSSILVGKKKKLQTTHFSNLRSPGLGRESIVSMFYIRNSVLLCFLEWKKQAFSFSARVRDKAPHAPLGPASLPR